jgi:hypothetical protein
MVCAGAFCLVVSETLLTFGAVAQIAEVADTLPAASRIPQSGPPGRSNVHKKTDAQGLQGKAREPRL